MQFSKLKKVCPRIKQLRWAIMIFGCASSIALILLAVFDTATYAAIHAYAAYAFVGFEAIALLNNVRYCFCKE